MFQRKNSYSKSIASDHKHCHCNQHHYYLDYFLYPYYHQFSHHHHYSHHIYHRNRCHHYHDHLKSLIPSSPLNQRLMLKSPKTKMQPTNDPPANTHPVEPRSGVGVWVGTRATGELGWTLAVAKAEGQKYPSALLPRMTADFRLLSSGYRGHSLPRHGHEGLLCNSRTTVP